MQRFVVGSRTRIWVPTSEDSGTGLLLHADTGLSLTASNKVTQWNSVYNGWSFTQATDSLRPLLSNWNENESAILNSGITTFSTRLNGTALFTPFESATAFTIFVVFNASDTGCIFEKGSQTPAERLGVVVISGLLYLVLNNSVVTTPIAYNTRYIATFTYSSGAVTIRLNGAQVATGTLPAITGANSNNRLILGPGVDPTVIQGLVRDIAVLPYTATTPQIQRMEGYLHWRYGGKSTTLNASHPFADQPPVIGG